jgi:hypothetical protein
LKLALRIPFDPVLYPFALFVQHFYRENRLRMTFGEAVSNFIGVCLRRRKVRECPRRPREEEPSTGDQITYFVLAVAADNVRQSAPAINHDFTTHMNPRLKTVRDIVQKHIASKAPLVDLQESQSSLATMFHLLIYSLSRPSAMDDWPPSYLSARIATNGHPNTTPAR